MVLELDTTWQLNPGKLSLSAIIYPSKWRHDEMWVSSRNKVIVLLLFNPCLFNLLVKLVSFRLQQFEVRLMMVQGIQPI